MAPKMSRRYLEAGKASGDRNLLLNKCFHDVRLKDGVEAKFEFLVGLAT
jgi:hypothetical protein